MAVSVGLNPLRARDRPQFPPCRLVRVRHRPQNQVEDLLELAVDLLGRDPAADRRLDQLVPAVQRLGLVGPYEVGYLAVTAVQLHRVTALALSGMPGGTRSRHYAGRLIGEAYPRGTVRAEIPSRGPARHDQDASCRSMTRSNAAPPNGSLPRPRVAAGLLRAGRG